MKILKVIDDDLAETLIKQNYRLLNKKVDINNVTIWTFDSDGFCFDTTNIDVKNKCFFYDQLTMTF